MKDILLLTLFFFGAGENVNQKDELTEAGTICNSPECQSADQLSNRDLLGLLKMRKALLSIDKRKNDTCVYYNKRYRFYSEKEKYVLPWDKYPWEVCLEESNLTDKKKEGVRQAMNIWNEGYKKYAKKRANKIPQLKDHKVLFVERCKNKDKNKDKSPIAKSISIKEIADLGKDSGGETFLGAWTRRKIIYLDKKDCKWSLGFSGEIEVEKNKEVWEGSHHRFINTMLHEFGHSLGISHLPPWSEDSPENTLIMFDAGEKVIKIPCDKYKQICELKDVDFDAFLKNFKFSGSGQNMSKKNDQI